ncbi:hypothetical protein [Porphyromonas circumdentaria]|uniref:hypothetical protein n=1 Tax=Porphyromonas circumdentaria TaxID=29524 RepID=UPI0013562AF0|nr:hypothetical protein [Porphyromonas circumdentaria]MBB6275487.1 hypothetical protein [Porphyromonas circumdentaria]
MTSTKPLSSSYAPSTLLSLMIASEAGGSEAIQAAGGYMPIEEVARLLKKFFLMYS